MYCIHFARAGSSRLQRGALKNMARLPWQPPLCVQLQVVRREGSIVAVVGQMEAEAGRELGVFFFSFSFLKINIILTSSKY